MVTGGLKAHIEIPNNTSILGQHSPVCFEVWPQRFQPQVEQPVHHTV